MPHRRTVRWCILRAKSTKLQFISARVARRTVICRHLSLAWPIRSTSQTDGRIGRRATPVTRFLKVTLTTWDEIRYVTMTYQYHHSPSTPLTPGPPAASLAHTCLLTMLGGMTLTVDCTCISFLVTRDVLSFIQLSSLRLPWVTSEVISDARNVFGCIQNMYYRYLTWLSTNIGF